MSVLFSFIIPHKNSPGLLKRCIDSIPDREDLEIIVIDDNSDKDKKPSIVRSGLSYIYLNDEQAKGPGHARNVGLERVKGKWVLFADADDSFTELLNTTLNTIKEKEVDVVYCNFRIIEDENVRLNTTKPWVTPITDDDLFRLKYSNTAPWNKIVSVSFIRSYRIMFDECLIGEDVLFSDQVAFFSGERFSVVNEAIYNYYITPNSITHKRKNDESFYLTSWKHLYQRNSFFRYIGEDKHLRSFLSKSFAVLIKKGWSEFAFFLKVFYSNREEIRRDENYYVNIINNKIHK